MDARQRHSKLHERARSLPPSARPEASEQRSSSADYYVQQFFPGETDCVGQTKNRKTNTKLESQAQWLPCAAPSCP